MLQDYGKISPTAVLVAFIRARYTEMPYTKEIYRAVREFNKPSLLERTPSFLSRLAFLFPRSAERVAGLEGRYLATNEALREVGNDFAVVEIASGLSPRGLDWSGRNSLYIETDLPEMLSMKKRVIGRVLQKMNMAEDPGHHFHTLNALEDSDWHRLGQTYFSQGRLNIAVITEGLINYLRSEEKEKIRDNIKKFFDNYALKGVWITPDFSLREDVMKGAPFVGYTNTRIERDTDRSYRYFANDDEVLEFLRQGGFEADFQDSMPSLNELTCISKLHLSRDRVRQVVYRYRVCVAVAAGTPSDR